MVKRAHLVHWLKFQLVFSSSSSGGGDGVGGGVIYLSCSLCRAERQCCIARTHCLMIPIPITYYTNIFMTLFDTNAHAQFIYFHCCCCSNSFRFISFRLHFLFNFTHEMNCNICTCSPKKKQQQEPLVVSLFNRISIMQSQCIIV